MYLTHVMDKLKAEAYVADVCCDFFCLEHHRCMQGLCDKECLFEKQGMTQI